MSATTDIDRVGTVETKGIEPVAPGERHGDPRELFWLWFAANFGILGVVYGGILAVYGVNLGQALLIVVIAAVLSYGLVGLISLAGPRYGLPTLAFSRMAFGRRGNAGPTLVSWITLVGWEVVTIVVATYALLDLASLGGLAVSTPLTAAALAVNVVLLATLGVLGHATLVWTQRIVTLVFGLTTLVAAVFVAIDTPWATVLAQPPGEWDTGVVAALTVVAAATGLTWVNCGADYTRYLPKASSTGAIVGWTVAGAGLAVLTTIMLGFALSVRVPDLASAANPVAVVREALPVWMAVPILVTAVVGLLAGGVTALYSSGMSLLTLGVPVPRYASVIIDGTLAAAGAAYLLFVSASFITWFQNFVQLATIGLAAWAGIMLVWIRAPRRAAGPIDAAAATAWLAGLAVGVLFSSSPLFVGPLATGLFAVSGLSYVLCLVVSAVVYALLSNGLGTRRPAAEPEADSAEVA